MTFNFVFPSINSRHYTISNYNVLFVHSKAVDFFILLLLSITVPYLLHNYITEQCVSPKYQLVGTWWFPDQVICHPQQLWFSSLTFCLIRTGTRFNFHCLGISTVSHMSTRKSLYLLTSWGRESTEYGEFRIKNLGKEYLDYMTANINSVCVWSKYIGL